MGRVEREHATRYRAAGGSMLGQERDAPPHLRRQPRPRVGRLRRRRIAAVADEQLLRAVVQDEGLGRDAERYRAQDAPGRRIHDAYPAGSGAH